ncbi:hypothetical protein [Aliarcobacter butzleri]|uniref:Uncharacterized protein n=1 Tax=Aliarcobacter butzleri L351 TaxID=1447259 RepID=A0A837J2R4_9BACT|nr:hypothetical protein [Aliarcobacter butzleri]KLD99510.1 hypothetical protein AF76_10600 [Aliarcobacter butzleri L351]KLE12431.1 hypothetical protein AF75_07935 [Aliarcobacter butzleri L350]
MKRTFIKNRKQQIIAVYDEWGNEIDIPVIFNKKNIVIDSNKIGKRKWKSIMLEIENRYDLMDENFDYATLSMNDEFIRKVERSISQLQINFFRNN